MAQFFVVQCQATLLLALFSAGTLMPGAKSKGPSAAKTSAAGKILFAASKAAGEDAGAKAPSVPLGDASGDAGKSKNAGESMSASGNAGKSMDASGDGGKSMDASGVASGNAGQSMDASGNAALPSPAPSSGPQPLAPVAEVLGAQPVVADPTATASAAAFSMPRPPAHDAGL